MNKDDVLLKKFNQKFIHLVRSFREAAPQLKDIIIIEDSLEFCDTKGNPEIPIRIFKISIYKYKKDIYNQDESIFEENKIMSEIMSTVSTMNESNHIDTEFDEDDNSKIMSNIKEAKNIWSSMSDEKKKNLWQTLQIMIILSEKININ